MVIEGSGEASPTVDTALLKAVARARRWFEDLVSGKASSILEIARRERTSDRYVSSLLPLAFLAPRLVDAIAQGVQPVHLTVQALTRRMELDMDWREQHRAFGA